VDVKCRVIPVHYKSLFKDSPYSNFEYAPKGECPNNYKCIKPALWSDAFRTIILWKYGGSYIDIDDISIRQFPRKPINIIPACALQDEWEKLEYDGGIDGKWINVNYKWRFGIDPLINFEKGNLFLRELISRMKDEKPVNWGQILPTKIFKENPAKWIQHLSPYKWHDILYHPKHDGHTDFDKRYKGKKIKWDEEASPEKIKKLLNNYKFPLVKNHNFCSDKDNSVLATLINGSYDINNKRLILKHDFNYYSENTKEVNSNWVIPQLVLIRMIQNEWIKPDILKYSHLTAGDGSPTGINQRDARIFMRHEPKGSGPRKDIDLFLDGNYLEKDDWKNRYYVPFGVMSFELRSHSPSQLLVPLGSQTHTPKTKFCCFMFGNIPSRRDFSRKQHPGAYWRYQLYKELDDKRRVERPKSNKMPRNIFEDAVSVYQPYQFVIASENAIVPGYITEKIFNAFLAGAIPIYYGTNHIKKYFNKDSFINANDFSSRKELIQYILRVADDPNLLSKYLSTPPCTEKQLKKLFRFWHHKCDSAWIHKLVDNIPKDLNEEERKFWILQCKHNLPINLMFADYLKTRNGKYCFVSRDCYFLTSLYKKMYPDDKSTYFWCSRNAMKNNSKSYINYTRHFVENGYTWVDLVGTNMSYCKFMKKNFGTLPDKNLLVYYDERTGHTPKNRSCLQNLTYLVCGGDGLGHRIGNAIETFNRSPELQLRDVVDGVPKYFSKKNEESVDRHKDWCVNCYKYIINNTAIEDLYMKYDKKVLLDHLKNLELAEPSIS